MNYSNNNSINYTPINTDLQKKNDNNIQYFFKHFKEYPLTEELKNVQKEFGDTDGGIKEEKDNIITNSTQIPYLSNLKKGRTYYLLNKNKCFYKANKDENNYFPRMHFFIGEEDENKYKKSDIEYEEISSDSKKSEENSEEKSSQSNESEKQSESDEEEDEKCNVNVVNNINQNYNNEINMNIGKNNISTKNPIYLNSIINESNKANINNNNIMSGGYYTHITINNFDFSNDCLYSERWKIIKKPNDIIFNTVNLFNLFRYLVNVIENNRKLDNLEIYDIKSSKKYDGGDFFCYIAGKLKFFFDSNNQKITNIKSIDIKKFFFGNSVHQNENLGFGFYQ